MSPLKAVGGDPAGNVTIAGVTVGGGGSEGSAFVEFDDNSLLPQLFGERDAHLDRIERALAVTIVPRGNRLVIAGTPSATDVAVSVLSNLYGRLKRGLEVGPAEVEAELRLAPARPSETLPLWGEPPAIRTRKRQISARTPVQADYIRALKESELVFGLGPAGTGKTYLAVAAAVDMLMSGQVSRIILSRPAVEAGERLGFLPGDLREKVDPYLRPLYDALHDMLPAEQIVKRMSNGDIEVAPLAFMRGRTLAGAFVILDEGQNTTPVQMKMFVTRLGEGSRMAITGDLSQIDLPRGTRSGLTDALETLEGVEGISVVRFGEQDVVRHPLVARIVRAYETRDRNRAALRHEPAPETTAPETNAPDTNVTDRNAANPNNAVSTHAGTGGGSGEI
jgi:phosphate starvation-inducible PhoH-like protein